MHHQFVSSSNLLSVGYEYPVLEVRFKHGGCYQYHGVPEGVYHELLNALPKGATCTTKSNPSIRATKCSDCPSVRAAKRLSALSAVVKWLFPNNQPRKVKSWLALLI
jgi:hypothetical protein